MRAVLFLPTLLALSFTAFAADNDFVNAVILNVESKQGLSDDLLGGGLQSDTHTVITLQIGDTKVSARTYSMGGGLIYLANHPEALIVGSTVKARLAKRGELQIQSPPEGKLLKFKIQRMEKVALGEN